MLYQNSYLQRQQTHIYINERFSFTSFFSSSFLLTFKLVDVFVYRLWTVNAFGNRRKKGYF